MFSMGAGSVLGMALQSDGSIVAVGASDAGGTSDALAERFHADGSRDTTFGTVHLPAPTVGDEFARAVTIQRDGKILVVGSVTDAGSNDFGVWRLTRSGALDTTFGGGDGFVPVGTAATDDVATDVAVDTLGRIVVVGVSDGADPDVTVVRLTPTGDLDGTFNDGLSFIVLPHAGPDSARAVTLQRDGNIVIAATYQGAAGYAVLQVIPGSATANARLDPNFGVAGVRDVPGTLADDSETDLYVTPDGSILLLDRVPSPVTAGVTDATVVRLTIAGNVDPTFGSATGAVIEVPNAASTAARGIAQLPDGDVVVVGGNGVGQGGGFVAELRSTGQPDPGMGRGGLKTFPADEAMVGVATLADGRVIVAGNRPGQSVLYRLKGDLKPPTCGGKRATIVGTAASEKLVGTARADVIVGLEGRDSITGLGKGDIVCGGSGNDKISGGGGADVLYGQSGRDTLIGGPGHDKLVGGTGRDVLKQ